MRMEKSQETTSKVATTETSSICQESRLTPGNTPISPMDKRSSDVEPRWQKLEAGVGLQRDDNDIPPGEDVEQQDGDLSPEEGIFLKEFPIMKAELEMAIRKYRALADDIDKTHKNFTQTSLVTSSVAVASGAMSLLGLALAPVTAGGSLMLTAAGQGLGAVAGATSVLTSILEYRHNKQAQAQVSRELSAPDPKVEEAVAYAVKAGKTVYNCGKTLKGIRKNIQALQVARAQPRLAAAAKRLLATGEASTQTTRRVQRAFRGTPLAMGSSAIFRSGVLNGLFLSMDVSSLLKDWQQLKQGTKTKLADLLRAKAEELERELTERTQLYEELQKLLQEKSLRSSSAKEATATLTQPPAKQGKAGPREAGEAEAG
ncbi:apolipoprotein L6 isoform X2 [Myotis lucifugus]|uniref:apolipoprotein L6 isoform X2 n=1 Tax=Myotis lucifugus TaxID=59463 RepID=UPI000CCC043A|nr:apolipoprotein L6 isoform X2 [Myotis lucifugus]